MSFDVWKPLYDDKFETKKYLYHYTTVDTAIKILLTNSLLFSRINETNDSMESKAKIDFEQMYDEDDIKSVEDFIKMKKEISKYFEQCREIVQLLCFSVDTRITEKDRKQFMKSVYNKDKYYDISGRGFAFPRMWAQYANNNSGVCLIFDKVKLLNQIKKRIEFVKDDLVIYKSFVDKYIVHKSQMEDLYERISMVTNGSLTMFNMIQNDKAFLKINFFEKLNDWENEHEYRIIVLMGNKDMNTTRIPVMGVNDFLEGIVIGEKMDDSYAKTLKMIIDANKMECDIKRIHFGSNICKLE